MDAVSNNADRFKSRDATSYDTVVGSFDRFTERYTAPLAQRLVDLVQLKEGSRVLDVATGTGVVARAVAEGGRGRSVGGDLSLGMLRRARQLAVRSGLDWVRLDAECLPFSAGSFDAAVSLFGLLHFPRPEQALLEMKRVVRPGGRVVIAVGSGPSRSTVAGMIDGLRRLRAHGEARLGRRLEAPRQLDLLVSKHLGKGDEPAESPLARGFRNRAKVVPHLLREAGFLAVRSSWQGHEAEVADPEEFWDLQATFSSRARKRLAEASPEAVAAVRRDFFAACEAVQDLGGQLVYPYAALFVVGRCPGGD
jgi:SAM-dependent methyltransferase